MARAGNRLIFGTTIEFAGSANQRRNQCGGQFMPWNRGPENFHKVTSFLHFIMPRSIAPSTGSHSLIRRRSIQKSIFLFTLNYILLLYPTHLVIEIQSKHIHHARRTTTATYPKKQETRVKTKTIIMLKHKYSIRPLIF